MTWRFLSRFCRAWLAMAFAASACAPCWAEPPAVPPANTAPAPTPGLEGRELLVMLRMAAPHLRAGTAYGGAYGDSSAQAARHRIAQELARHNGLTLANSWPMPLLGVDCFVMVLPAGGSLDDAMAAVRKDHAVTWAQPLATYRAMASAEGVATGSPDPLMPVQPAYTFWHIDFLHRLTTGRGVAVAVIDSRIDTTHPDLIGQFSTDQDFVDRSPLDKSLPSPETHGTGIAGVIGAKAGNGIGIAGVAPGVRMMALRACWQAASGNGAPETVCNSLTLGRALQFAIEHQAQVINLSLSGPPDPLLRQLVDLALARHIAVVAAIDPRAFDGGFPSTVPGVVAVSDMTMHRITHTYYVAPGRDIPTTQPGGKWSLVNGSSYAAAHVTGLLAMARANAPTGPIHLARARDGTIDACATLAAMLPHCGCACGNDGRLAQVARH